MTVLMITIDGGTLSYNVSGAGPPIVFVAGLGDRGTYWTAQVAAFSSAFQVVTFDHRGVGASEGQPPYKVEQWAADTLRLIGRCRTCAPAASRPSSSRPKTGCR
jgi:aminoacrylate hydrolase